LAPQEGKKQEPLGGAEVAALFHGLFESAELAGVEPKNDLLKATHEAIADRKATTLPRELLS
jgi:hypothetical protein